VKIIVFDQRTRRQIFSIQEGEWNNKFLVFNACFVSALHRKINFVQQSQQQQIELGFASTNLPSTFSVSSVRRMPNLQ